MFVDRFVIILVVLMCRLGVRYGSGGWPASLWCVVACLGRRVDALADRTDEGRLRQRYSSGSRQQGFDPRVSECGNTAAVMGGHRLRPGGTQGSETSQYLQERIFRE